MLSNCPSWKLGNGWMRAPRHTQCYIRRSMPIKLGIMWLANYIALVHRACIVEFRRRLKLFLMLLIIFFDPNNNFFLNPMPQNNVRKVAEDMPENKKTHSKQCFNTC